MFCLVIDREIQIVSGDAESKVQGNKNESLSSAEDIFNHSNELLNEPVAQKEGELHLLFGRLKSLI